MKLSTQLIKIKDHYHLLVFVAIFLLYLIYFLQLININIQFYSLDLSSFKNYLTNRIFEHPQWSQKISLLLTPTKFKFAKILLGIFDLAFISIFLFIIKKFISSKSTIALNSRINKILNFYKSLPWHEKLFLGIMMAIILSFYIFQFAVTPVSHDEATTFNFFISKPFTFTYIFYPFPNNHILYSLIGNPIFWLGGNEFISMRLPTLLITIISLFYFFRKTYSNFGGAAAFLSLALFSSTTIIFYYSFMGRGYSLIDLAFIGVIFKAIDILKSNDIQHFKSFAIWNLIGVITIPTFFIAWFWMIIFVTIFKIKSFREWKYWLFVTTNLKYILLAVLFYLPVYVANNGITMVETISSQNFTDFAFIKWQVTSFFRYYFSNNSFLVGPDLIIFTVAISMLLWHFKREKTIILVASTFLIPLITFFFLRVSIPERTWSFVTVSVVLIIAITTSKYLYNKYLTITSALIILLGNFYFNYDNDFKSFTLDRDLSAKKIADVLESKPDAKIMVHDAGYIKPMMLFYKSRMKTNWTFYSDDPKSLDFNANHANLEFDFVISSDDGYLSDHKHFTTFFKDENYKLVSKSKKDEFNE